MSRFLSAFESYFSQRTDAPPEFGHAAGLMCLSTVALGRRWLNTGLHPNIYMLLVGPSSRDRKSTSIGIGMDLLAEVDPRRLGPSEFSPEGLCFYMRKKAGKTSRNKITIAMSEFGTHLAASKKNYAQGIGALMCQLYDGETITRAKAGKRPIVVKNPRLNLFGGCSYGMLEKYCEPVDWEGGFFARILFIAGTKRPISYPSLPATPTALRDAAKAGLNDVKRDCEIAPGEMALTPAALSLYESYVKSVPDDNADPALVAQRERLLNTVPKLAALYQIDLAGIPGQIPMIDVPAVEKAIAFAKTAWLTFSHVFAHSSSTYKARTMARIWEVVTEGRFVPRRELLRRFTARIDELQPILDQLTKSGAIRPTVEDQQSGYEVLVPYQA